MTDAFILSACRTPIGKFRGTLSSLSASRLGSIVIEEAIRRCGNSRDMVDEVIMGNVLPAGVGQAPARQAALEAGLPPSTNALTINKVCGSGLKAVMLAAQSVRCGDSNLVIAGGMECMSRAPYLADRNPVPLGDRTLTDSMMRDGLTCGISDRVMGDIAESVAENEQISREAQDEFAASSQQKAALATTNGAFRDEIVPVTIKSKRGDKTIDQDECPRAETTRESLSGLRSVFQANGTVTAGNASTISDGAAAVVVASQPTATRNGSKPMAKIVASATAHVKPEDLFLAPIAAIQNLLRRANMALSDIDLFELNEAFASQAIADIRQLDIPLEKVNVNGGAIALGHPIGASGARVLVTLLHALRTRNSQFGVASLCLGGGGAVAMLVENLA
jgi:acetyl-CoA C-acetyltransferase